MPAPATAPPHSSSSAIPSAVPDVLGAAAEDMGACGAASGVAADARASCAPYPQSTCPGACQGGYPARERGRALHRGRATFSIKATKSLLRATGGSSRVHAHRESGPPSARRHCGAAVIARHDRSAPTWIRRSCCPARPAHPWQRQQAPHLRPFCAQQRAPAGARCCRCALLYRAAACVEHTHLLRPQAAARPLPPSPRADSWQNL